VKAKARLTIAILCAAVIALPVAALGTSAQNGRNWTVLMYFGADNDLYQATYFGVNQTLKGISEGGADPDEVAVVVLFDGPEVGDTCVWDLSSGAVEDRTGDFYPGPGSLEANMTEKDVLVDFIVWAMSQEEYKARNTMLVLKNGHAWCGICPDGTDNDGDEKILMPIDELRGGLVDVYDALTGAWIDVLVFDGDNMGSIEVAYELREVTSYFVGSQQQVPLEGLPYYLFMRDLVKASTMNVEQACVRMVEDYVEYYNNTQGNKQSYDKLISNSQMSVTAAAFRMGEGGEKIAAVVDRFDNYLNYMLTGTLPAGMYEHARDNLSVDVDAKLAQWLYPNATGVPVWSWIPLNRNNISSARDCALIGKMNDQQGYEWLPDSYTWLWSISALSNYEAYGDVVPPSGDNPLEIPEISELVDPFIRLLLEDFMGAFGYVEPGIYRGTFDATTISPDGALVWLAQCQILNRSGNSFPHGLNIWFPPSWLQWDIDDSWSDLFNKPMTYAYWGVEIADGSQTEVVYLPAEYYCIDCPTQYNETGLDFTSDTVWMDFFEVYYDSRWLIYGSGDDTGSRDDNKP